MIEFTIPVKTVNESNGQHGHWTVKSGRRKKQRAAAWHALTFNATPPPALPARVTLTRISAGELDEHDNLRGALKTIADAVAEHYAIPDKDKRFTWEYAQEKCKRGQYGVRIRIESIAEGK